MLKDRPKFGMPVSGPDSKLGGILFGKKCDGSLLRVCNTATTEYRLQLEFLPRDATQSAIMPQYIVCLSVRP